MLGRRSIGSSRRRSTARPVLILLIIISLVAYLANRGNDEAFKTARTQADSVGTIVLTYLSLPIRGMENLISDINLRFKAHSENERLRQEVSKISDLEARANALTIKLARFERIMNVDVGSGIPEMKIAARAVSEIDGPFVRSALINVGAKDGVSKGDAVMTVNGLYGHIINLGKSSSRVLKLEDINSRIAVMSKSTQARAILMGTNSKIPELTFSSLDSVWETGDEILTSGDDGVLPMGLPVGRVLNGDNGRVTVELYSNQEFVDWVWVYPFEPTPKPEDNPVDVIADEGDNIAEAVESEPDGLE